MRVNELARELEVTGDTVRFYTRIGFLKPEKIRPMATRSIVQGIGGFCSLF
jgi:DNA-binding transcriptional MerR regulator